MAERRDLVRVFTHEQFVSRGMIADIALRDPGGLGARETWEDHPNPSAKAGIKSDPRNHYAHIQLPIVLPSSSCSCEVKGVDAMRANYISKSSKVDPNVELEAPVRTYGNVSIKKGSKIGAFTFINVGSRITANTHVGRYCSIGRNCEIGAYDHPDTWLTSSPFAYNIGGHFPDFKGQ